ncbi:hypothetical protein D3C81_1562740 [compost metagenome]
MLQQGLFEGVLLSVVDGLAQVDAGNHGAQGRAEGFEGEVGHFGVLVLDSGCGTALTPALSRRERGLIRAGGNHDFQSHAE